MKVLKWLAGLVVSLLLLPLIVLFLPLHFLERSISSAILRRWFRRTHVAHGRPVLFVYSDSPNWQAYIEANILPRIRDRAVVLNWSQRQHWSVSSPWEARFFRRFAGEYGFNPLALVCGEDGEIRAIPFFQAFREFKHGDDSALRTAESALFDFVEGRTATTMDRQGTRS